MGRRASTSAAPAGAGSEAKAKLDEVQAVVEAVKQLGEKTGSSAQAIKKLVGEKHDLSEKEVTAFVAKALKKAVQSGLLSSSNRRYVLAQEAEAPSANGESKNPGGASDPEEVAGHLSSPKRKAEEQVDHKHDGVEGGNHGQESTDVPAKKTKASRKATSAAALPVVEQPARGNQVEKNQSSGGSKLVQGTQANGSQDPEAGASDREKQQSGASRRSSPEGKAEEHTGVKNGVDQDRDQASSDPPAKKGRGQASRKATAARLEEVEDPAKDSQPEKQEKSRKGRKLTKDDKATTGDSESGEAAKAPAEEGEQQPSQGRRGRAPRAAPETKDEQAAAKTAGTRDRKGKATVAIVQEDIDHESGSGQDDDDHDDDDKEYNLVKKAKKAAPSKAKARKPSKAAKRA